MPTRFFLRSFSRILLWVINRYPRVWAVLTKVSNHFQWLDDHLYVAQIAKEGKTGKTYRASVGEDFYALAKSL